MAYVTSSAKDLIDRLHMLDAWAMARRTKAKDAYERGLYDGYQAAMKLVLERAIEAMPHIEADARLVPEASESYATLRERLIAEEWTEGEARFAFGDR